MYDHPGQSFHPRKMSLISTLQVTIGMSSKIEPLKAIMLFVEMLFLVDIVFFSYRFIHFKYYLYAMKR